MPFYNPAETDRAILTKITCEAQANFELCDAWNLDFPVSTEAALKTQGYIRGLVDAWSIFNRHSHELIGTKTNETF